MPKPHGAAQASPPAVVRVQPTPVAVYFPSAAELARKAKQDAEDKKFFEEKAKRDSAEVAAPP